MNLVTNYLRELTKSTIDGWNRFWFAPQDVATLAVIRIMAGAMLLYTHAVWTIGLTDFFGEHSWISAAAARAARGDRYEWSWFWLIDSPALLWTVHIASLAVFAMLMLGLYTRVVSVLAFLAAVAYANRVPGAQFGLDTINVMLAMYLMIGPAGDAYSLDRLRARGRAGGGPRPAAPAVSANLAIRLIQVHMCVIYFFAGLSKLQGETWWEGTALWGAVANLEYQSVDMTWLASWPVTIALLTHVTAFWELSFCALVWPRLIRPIVLLVAVPLHLGIAVCMGMITFGLVMLIGCFSFVPPWLVRRVLEGPGEQGRAGGRAESTSATTTPRQRAGRLQTASGARRG